MSEREGFFQRIYHELAERTAALVDRNSRRRTVLTVIQSKNNGEQPDEEILHHFRHIPPKAVKEIILKESKFIERKVGR